MFCSLSWTNVELLKDIYVYMVVRQDTTDLDLHVPVIHFKLLWFGLFLRYMNLLAKH